MGSLIAFSNNSSGVKREFTQATTVRWKTQRPSNRNVIIRTQTRPPHWNVCETRVSSPLTDSTSRSRSSHLRDVGRASSHLTPGQHTIGEDLTPRNLLADLSPAVYWWTRALLTKGFILSRACNVITSCPQGRGAVSLGVARWSPRHEVKGHRSVCCVLLVKRSFIIIPGHCLVMLIWHHVCNKGFV